MYVTLMYLEYFMICFQMYRITRKWRNEAWEFYSFRYGSTDIKKIKKCSYIGGAVVGAYFGYRVGIVSSRFVKICISFEEISLVTSKVSRWIG